MLIHLSNYIYQPMTKERWESVQKFKEMLNSDTLENALYCDSADPRIVDSWLRCHRAGLRPSALPQLPQLPEKQTLPAILSQNQYLCEATETVLEKLKPVFNSNREISCEINEKNGCRIFHYGKIRESPYDVLPFLYEEYIGTNCCTLVHEYHCPTLLYGVEHYLEMNRDVLSAGAPIFDRNNHYLGAVFLAKSVSLDHWDTPREDSDLMLLNLAITFANAIGTQRELMINKEQVKDITVESLYKEAKLELIQNYTEDGIVHLNRDGYITSFNQAALYMLSLPLKEEEHTELRHFSTYLKNPRGFSLMLQRHQSSQFNETLLTASGETMCSFYYTPFITASTQELRGAVLKITPLPQKYKTAKDTGVHLSFSFRDIIGESEEMKEAIKTAKFLAPTGENILLTGESGTGKELFAQAIHESSNPSGPFIALNCAALPQNLIESELFGYEAGAFTGATKSGRPGKIELANNGTLFLDEIGDMPIELQTVLLRVLQDKQVARIGGANYKSINFRIIAATNQDLNKLIEEKKFRIDLYFRLSVLSLHIPPLRERKGDVELLTRYFIERYCREKKLPIPDISDEVFDLLKRNPWPGNVRELEGAIKYSIYMAQGNRIEAKHLNKDILHGVLPQKSNRAAPPLNPESDDETLLPLTDLEALYVKKALKATNNNATRAAALLGISKTTLYRKMKNQEIK